MSSDIVVKAEGAGKAYAMFARPENRLKQMLFGRWRTYYNQFWALRGIDLEIRRGETWGIIGRNGSGKSTLLQIICGNLSPTIGTVSVIGRIAALLELGAGFNPEFTGRENVYMNGVIAGYNRAQVDERLDGILAFADIGAFIEQPVKTYSSGMFARLAFAVAVSVDPDLLIVDEALAVGDEAFQRKCFARMERIKSDGATILFVSHATATVVDLCDHAILLHQGEHLYTGRPKRTVAWYQKLMAAPAVRIPEILTDIRTAVALGGGRVDALADPLTGTDALHDMGFVEAQEDADETDTASLDPGLVSVSTLAFEPNGAEISQARLLTLAGAPVNCLVPGERYKFCYCVTFMEAARNVKFYCMTKVVNGVHLGGGQFPPGQQTIPLVGANEVIDICFEFDCVFGFGTYFLNCGVASRGELLHRILDVLAFRVGRGQVRPAVGTIDLNISVDLRSAGAAEQE